MIATHLIDRLEESIGEPMEYAREIARESPAGFWKFALMGPLLQHRGTVSTPLWHLARLGSLRVEDCGPCVQTVVNAAAAAGVPAERLREALAGGAELPPLERDAYFFGRGVAGGEPIDDPLRERLGAALGPQGLVDLTLAAASGSTASSWW